MPPFRVALGRSTLEIVLSSFSKFCKQGGKLEYLIFSSIFIDLMLSLANSSNSFLLEMAIAKDHYLPLLVSQQIAMNYITNE